MGYPMRETAMKVKNTQPTHRNWWKCLIVLLLAVASVPAVLFSTWVSMAVLCYIPTEISLPETFTQFILQNDHTEAELAQLAYNKTAWELAWLGSIEVGEVYFRDTCQLNTCVLDFLYIDIAIERFPIFSICTWFELGPHSVIVYEIDISKSQVEARIHQVQTWSAPARGGISSDIAQVRERLLHAIDDNLWKIYPTLVLIFNRWPDSWKIRVYTTHGTLLYEEKVDHSEYQNQ